MTNSGALHAQCFARARQFHILITAKRGHGSIDAGQAVLGGTDCEVAVFNQAAKIPCIFQQSLPINLPRIVEPRTILRPTPAHKRLPAVAMRLDRAVMPAAKHIAYCLWPGIAQLPTPAKIAPIPSPHKCHDQTPLQAKP